MRRATRASSLASCLLRVLALAAWPRRSHADLRAPGAPTDATLEVFGSAPVNDVHSSYVAEG